jgi:hypothetical protein
MNIRNAKYKNNKNTVVDLEIEHEVYGWIPYTFISDQPGESFDSEIREWLKTNTPDAYVAPVKTNSQLLQEANIEYEKQVAILVDGTPAGEIKTWTKQETEARQYLVDNTISTPLIDAMSQARGVSKEWLVAKIIQKADLYAQEVGRLTGLRQKKEDELKA